MKIVELMKEFEEHYIRVRLKPTTAYGYLININNHIIPAIGEYEIEDLNYIVVDCLVLKLNENGLNNTSIVYVLSVLRKALTFAIQREYINYNALYTYDFPVRNRYLYQTLNREQIKLINQSLTIDNDIYPAVHLALNYGLRRGECCGMTIDDKDSLYKIIRIERSMTYISGVPVLTDLKTDSSKRVIMISDITNNSLSLYNAVRIRDKDGYLIRNKQGKKLTTTQINKGFNRFVSELGLPNIRFHDLRHTYATNMLMAGVSAKIVSSVLGHSSIKVTSDIYGHFDYKVQSACLDVLQKVQ